MSLLWRVMSAFGALLLRAAGLFLCIFVVHLVVTRAWPSLKRSAELAEQRPGIERTLHELQERLAHNELTAQQLSGKLVAASALQLRQLEETVRAYQDELAELTEQRNALVQRLQEAHTEQQEYCTTWNPLKRYLCHEVKARVARTVKVVQPLLDELQETAEELSASLEQAQSAVADFESQQPLARASTPQARTLRLALYEKEAQSAALRVELERVRAHLAKARAAEASPAAWLIREVRRVGFGLLAIVFGVLMLPYLQRTFAYFVFMPLVQRASALRLVEPSASGTLTVGPALRSLPIELEVNEHCWVRANYARPVEGRTRSQWLFDWSAPFVSYAAGLSIVTRIEGPDSATSPPTLTTLASPEDADSYLMEVRLVEHPGLVVHPRNLVAVAGHIQLATRWRLFSVHAWATGQLRFILVRGSGRCVLEGRGDVTAGAVKRGRARIEQENVLGFDTRLGYATARTETFLPYLLGRTSLVTDVFCGEGLFFWQKNPRLRAANVVQRSFDAVFGAIGKLLGF